MSEHPPVTEEMVKAAVTAGGYYAEHVPRYLTVLMLEAAQAVAPPKDDADTKRLDWLNRELVYFRTAGHEGDGYFLLNDLPQHFGQVRTAIDAAMRASSPAAPATPSTDGPEEVSQPDLHLRKSHGPLPDSLEVGRAASTGAAHLTNADSGAAPATEEPSPLIVNGSVATWKPSSPSGASAWTPTAANINALPEPIRRYIHDIETNADPAGTVRELTIARDTIRSLELLVPEPPAEHPCALCGGDGPTHLTPSDRYLCTECWDDSSASSLTLAEKLELDLDARNLRHD